MAATGGGTPVVIGGLTLDPERWEASLHGRPLHLTRTEFSLLLLMARQPGRAFSRDQLLDAVWGTGYLAGSNVVDQAMAGLRRKLGDEPRAPTYIETVTGVGYRLRAPRQRPIRARLAVPALGAAGAIVAAALAAGLAVWLLDSDGRVGGFREVTYGFHATARLIDPGRVTGADCSEDLLVADSQSESVVTGDIVGRLEATSTSRLYQDTDCLSGVSDTELVLTDDEGDTLEGSGHAPVITYRLPTCRTRP